MPNEQTTKIATDFIDMFDTYDYEMSKDVTGRGKVVMTDKTQNSFATICKFVDDLLVTLNDQFRF